MRASAWLLLLFALVSSAACGPTVDLTKGLQVTIVDSGWFDLGIVNGQNKLVPAVIFTLQQHLGPEAGDAADQRAVPARDRKHRMGQRFPDGRRLAGTRARARRRDPITIKSQLGYTGSDQSRVEMLQNTHFVDAKVELFGKYGPTQWVRLGSYPIKRQLLTK